MRRLALIPIVLAVTAVAPVASHAADLTEAQAQQIGTDAYDYGFPLMEFLRVARTQTSVTVPDARADAPVNRLGNARKLADATEKVIVQPNTDTLYTSSHLDLRRGALVLHVPRIRHHRYYNFEFLDPYTNVFAYIGTRATGNGGGDYLLTGPGFHGRVPRGMRRIRLAYRRAWMLGRTLVDGRSDLPAVHRIQNAYRLIPLNAFRAHRLGWRPPRPHRVIRKPASFSEPTGLAFFDALGAALKQNPPPARDGAILAELRQAGIGPGLHPSQEHLSPAVIAGLEAAVAGGPGHIDSLRQQIGTTSVVANHGWFVPPADIGSYGTDYAFRAVVAKAGLAANRPKEALYIVGYTDPSLSLLDGAHDYVIHFPAGQLPPARYFWSLTMYDQSFFLVSNPLGRYELGDRSRGLKRNPDGSLDIYLQSTPPHGHESNWLPAPTGTFEVTLRLYGPGANAVAGTYAYPPITRDN